MKLIEIFKTSINEETDGITIFLNKIQAEYDISDSLYVEILKFIEGEEKPERTPRGTKPPQSSNKKKKGKK